MPLIQVVRRLALILVVAVLAIAAMLWTLTFASVPPMLATNLQPTTFPQLVSGLILVLAVIAAVETLSSKEEDPHRALPRPFYLTVGVMAVAAIVAMTFDFLAAMMIGAAGISAAWGERRISVLAGVGIVAPVLIFLLFDDALQIRFPHGVLLDIYYGW